MVQITTEPSFDEPKNKKTGKMVRVRINIPTIRPDFDITVGAKEIENKSESEILAMPHLNVGFERNKMLNNLLQPGDEIEVSEEVAKAWEEDTYMMPGGSFGVINSSQLGIAPPQLLNNMSLEQFYEEVNQFGEKVKQAINVKVARATRLS